MSTLDAIAALIPTLTGRIRAGSSTSDVQAVIEVLGDAEAVATFQEAGDLGRLVEQIQVICAGVIARRSRREAGHSGLAQSRGHRSAASLIQELGGMTKGEAARRVRVGESLLDDGPDRDTSGLGGDGPSSGDGDASDGGGSPDGGRSSDRGDAPEDDSSGLPPVEAPSVREWREVLRTALRSGQLTTTQFDAIQRGLGDPPDGAAAAWVLAAEQLVEEASRRTVEELAASSRTIRDILDPEGAETRSLARYERRSFRTWLDQDGIRHANAVFDDEGGAYLDSIFAAALRPRRGGPRFVDADEKAQAADLTADTRSNDQLAYDLLLDLIRAGALADPAAVFGTRQAGLRLVQTVDQDGAVGPVTVTVTEDGLASVPASVAERRVCEAGTVSFTVDSCGNPLDAGRESRLFTPRQRVGLAIRDGGCRWPGCDRPASYAEAHHIDEWTRDAGRTDIDRGILLCRFHHMELHHGGWAITRDGKEDFVLHHRDGHQVVLHPRLALRCAWGDIAPPPRRFRPAA
ncbi:MAG: DUF222 domain-containing protein [Actinobacteria bacterium]|nr:DUF222 domain-containing protein [Actinomycetota bacterium]